MYRLCVKTIFHCFDSNADDERGSGRPFPGRRDWPYYLTGIREKRLAGHGNLHFIFRDAGSVVFIIRENGIIKLF